MNRKQITAANGRVAYFDRAFVAHTTAHVLNTDSLYETHYGSFYAPRWSKTSKTVCKSTLSTGVGFLALTVGYVGYGADRADRIKAAEKFIADFNGTVSDVIDSRGHLIDGVLPAGVSLRIVASRELFAR